MRISHNCHSWRNCECFPSMFLLDKVSNINKYQNWDSLLGIYINYSNQQFLRATITLSYISCLYLQRMSPLSRLYTRRFCRDFISFLSAYSRNTTPHDSVVEEAFFTRLCIGLDVTCSPLYARVKQSLGQGTLCRRCSDGRAASQRASWAYETSVATLIWGGRAEENWSQRCPGCSFVLVGSYITLIDHMRQYSDFLYWIMQVKT